MTHVKSWQKWNGNKMAFLLRMIILVYLVPYNKVAVLNNSSSSSKIAISTKQYLYLVQKHKQGIQKTLLEKQKYRLI